MPATESRFRTTPPLAMTCTVCDDGEMKPISIEPETDRTLYVYDCRKVGRPSYWPQTDQHQLSLAGGGSSQLRTSLAAPFPWYQGKIQGIR